MTDAFGYPLGEPWQMKKKQVIILTRLANRHGVDVEIPFPELGGVPCLNGKLPVPYVCALRNGSMSMILHGAN